MKNKKDQEKILEDKAKKGKKRIDVIYRKSGKGRSYNKEPEYMQEHVLHMPKN